MCIRDSSSSPYVRKVRITMAEKKLDYQYVTENVWEAETRTVSYTHLRAHETVLDLVCRLLLEKKKNPKNKSMSTTTPKQEKNRDAHISGF
mgnify:CR=1 FL=1